MVKEFFSRLFKRERTFSIDELQAYAGQMTSDPITNSIYDGGKYYGGFGDTQIYDVDYETLRARSNQLFTENLYAKGLIRRLITNEINTGLTPEARPDESILGLEAGSLDDWTENVENRFSLWADNPLLCDYLHEDNFGSIQRKVRREALISGDVLVILRESPRTHLPMIQVISGESVQSPCFGSFSELREGHEIKHGVETDAEGRVVAYWVRQKDLNVKRIPAWGEKSGRRISWLVFGTEKRVGEVRGMPLLAVVLQSLKEQDRMRDSAQRKAFLNSNVAMFIKKTQDKMGTLPFSGAAVRRDTAAITDGDGKQRTFNVSKMIPGIVMETLQQGEEPVPHSTQGTDINYAAFEECILRAIAWANEVPPEILLLSFSSNYSASQAAINECRIYLNKIWESFGASFCGPIYTYFLLSETLTGKIITPGFLEARRDPLKYDIYGAWIAVDWYGSIKPSTDMFKQGKGSALLVEHAWSTNSRESRVITGTKFSRNVARLRRENEIYVEAMRPLAEFNQLYGAPRAVDENMAAISEEIERLTEAQGL